MAQNVIDPEMKKDLAREDLVYTTDSKPGILRERFGKDFEYYDVEGKRIKDKKITERINSLAIPPAWKNVWISPKANGHLQATGTDDRKRKQYIYHPDWIKISQQNKFEKMIDFGLSLPKIRNKLRYDMESKTLDKKKVLATIVWLLEHTFIRIGNEEYREENNSFGLTTLRNRHATVKGHDVTLKFIGKSGVENIYEFTNKKVARTIKQSIELPGYELFQYIDENNDRRVVDSSDVNAFLKEVTEDDFTAKDFRTWGATNLSAEHLYEIGDPEDELVAKKNINQAVKHVASYLNNTATVCRSYYIHPTVINSYAKKDLIPHFSYYKKAKTTKPGLAWEEYALIKLLEKYPYKPAV